MTFSATIQPSGTADLRLDVRGQVLGAAATALEVLIIEAIVVRLPDTFLISLRHATALSIPGVRALLTGYITAVDYGTFYRVLHARGSVHHVLRATGTLEVLADSEDLGALMVARLALPSPGKPA